jgi:hypothetical protein
MPVRALVALSALLFAAFAEVAGAPAAHACSCVPFTDRQAYDRADVVFVGRVLGVTAPGGPVRSSTDPALWTFAVGDVYKGSAATRQGVVSARFSASCGLEVEQGGTYVVFARREPGPLEPRVDGPALFANLCGGTRTIAERPVPADFGDVRAPAPGESAPVDVEATDRDLRRVIAGAALVAALGVSVLVVVLRRRRGARAQAAGRSSERRSERVAERPSDR